MTDKESKLPAHLRPPAWKKPKGGESVTYRDPTAAAAIGRIGRGKKTTKPMSGPEWCDD